LTTFLSGRVDEDDLAFLMDVPGPLGALTGVRVDEWDARDAQFVNPVRLCVDDAAAVEVDARLFFELVIAQGAQTVGTYQSDYYAGTPAVTRNAFGAGEGWYVAAALDQAGVDWVVRRILDRHGLAGPYADVADVETAVRVAPDGSRLLFLLNHRAEPVAVDARFAGTELLTDTPIKRGAALSLPPRQVLVVREDSPE
jgi:beta-galactosidase